MDKSELKQLSLADLRKALNEALAELFKNRVQIATGQSQKTHLLKQLKKQVALIKTLINQKQNAEAN